MARDLSTGMVTQITASVIYPVLMAEVALVSSTIYVWSGIGTLNWNGQDWLGVGDLGKISSISETTDLQANGIALTLTGVANDILSDSLTEIRQGLPATIYLGALTPTGTLVDSPIALYQGAVDKPTTKIGASTSTVTINVENRLLDMQRARLTRLTSEDQKRNWPQDTGLDFVPQLADAAWKWGN